MEVTLPILPVLAETLSAGPLWRAHDHNWRKRQAAQ
jgi:hypothetical protein